MSNLSDVVGGADFYNGSRYSFTSDRFCIPNEAIYLSRGYLQVPPGVYFWGDFTLTFWVNMKGSINPLELSTVILDFSSTLNEDGKDKVAIGIGQKFSLHSLGYLSYISDPSSCLQTNKWYHVSIVLKGSKGLVYLNGIFLSDFTNQVYQSPLNVSRIYNYIGKTNMLSYSYANATYDEIKIYVGALNSSQIYADFAESSGLLNFFICVFVL